MSEWLQKLWKGSKHPLVRTIILFMTVFLAVLGLASTISDAGFAREIQEHRALVWKFSFGIALVIALGWLIFKREKELMRSRQLVGKLQQEISRLKEELSRSVKERDSAFELMKQYRAQTQEDVLNQLQQLALFGMLQEQWRKKGAKVERLRVEEATQIEIKDQDLEIEKQIAVIVNLGARDEVVAGMEFIVQDPADCHEYGIIRVQGVYPSGASCIILQMSDMAFWNDVVEAVEQKRPQVFDAPSNMIVPVSPLREIPSESAQELLTWLQNIRRAEL